MRRLIETACHDCAAEVEVDFDAPELPAGWSWATLVRWTSVREEIQVPICPDCTRHRNGEDSPF